MSEQNGTAPRIQRREKWLELPDVYAEFKVKVWVNAPAKLWSNILSNDEIVARDAAMKIVLEHNGWLDFAGEPYPSADDPAFWDEIPTELGACILAATRKAIQDLPNSLAPTRRR